MPPPPFVFDSNLNPTFLAPCLFSKLNSRRTTFPRIMEAATLVSPYPQQKSLPLPQSSRLFAPNTFFRFLLPSLLLCAQTPTAEFPVPISAQCPKLLRGRPLSSPFFVFVLFLLGAHPGLLLFILRIRSLGHRTFLLGPKVNNLCFVFFSFPSLYLLQNPHTLEGT